MLMHEARVPHVPNGPQGIAEDEGTHQTKHLGVC